MVAAAPVKATVPLLWVKVPPAVWVYVLAKEVVAWVAVKVPAESVKVPEKVTNPADAPDPPVKIPPLWLYGRLNVMAPAWPTTAPATSAKEVVVPAKAVVPVDGPFMVTLA